MRDRVAFGIKLGFDRAQATRLARLDTPEKIQDFVSALRSNPEHGGDTCLSAVEVLNQGHAHCIEAGFLAAAAFWMQGEPPLLMDFHAEGDDDHVVALFRRGRHWGAISKSNHVWLRWRDPIYRSLRELALSYFHEYVNGPLKTMRAYSHAYDLRRIDKARWITNRDNCWDVAEAIDRIRHYPLVTRAQARRLRRRDRMELRADKILEYPKEIAAEAARG